MEAISGQILFDFDAGELGGIKSFPERKPKINRTRESEVWFQKGLELEETGAPVEDAVDAYQKVLELNPGAAGALVNLGTIYYRMRKFARGREVLSGRDRGGPRIPAGAVQPRQPVRRAGTPAGSIRFLPAGAGVEPALRRRAFQPGAAVRTPGRCHEGRPPLEGLSETGPLRAVGRHRAPAVGTSAASRHPVAAGRCASRALLSLILGAIELNRIVLAFRAFFNLLFSGELSAEILIALNLSRRSAAGAAEAGRARARRSRGPHVRRRAADSRRSCSATRA